MNAVLQVSFDLQVPEDIDDDELLEMIGSRIDGLNEEIFVLGADVIEDLTDTYKDMYGIDVNADELEDEYE